MNYTNKEIIRIQEEIQNYFKTIRFIHQLYLMTEAILTIITTHSSKPLIKLVNKINL